ncbi:R3H-assoc domain-containing protein [Forsythia ovata]|uniref:R3H-assoc domain-containing protein n=1 Tax=Forsythia ovata TaxID=205694 RepID=A0ABD1TS00_9LAMI
MLAKEDLQRTNLDLDSLKEKIKENQEKINLNKQLPYLVGSIVEASIIESLEDSSGERRSCLDADKVDALTAWHRIDCKTREALRRCFLSELIDSYEVLEIYCKAYNFHSSLVSTSHNYKINVGKAYM